MNLMTTTNCTEEKVRPLASVSVKRHSYPATSSPAKPRWGYLLSNGVFCRTPDGAARIVVALLRGNEDHVVGNVLQRELCADLCVEDLTAELAMYRRAGRAK